MSRKKIKEDSKIDLEEKKDKSRSKRKIRIKNKRNKKIGESRNDNNTEDIMENIFNNDEINSKDKERLLDIKNIINEFDEPLIYLPATLGLTFSKIFDLSFDNIEKVTDNNVLDMLKKIYPYIID